LSGDTSTGRPRRRAWSPARRRIRPDGWFPFTNALDALVAEQWRQHEALQKAGTICRYVFHRNGKRIKTFKGAWKAACEAAGCPGRIPHDLRRSAVRNMERAGLSRSVAMQLTGHKTEAVYRRYAITSEADLREGVDRLNGGASRNTTGKQSA
jgi:integrase